MMATVVDEIEGKDLKSQERPQKGRGAPGLGRRGAQASKPHHTPCLRERIHGYHASASNATCPVPNIY